MTTASFEKSIVFVLNEEGGYVNDSDDPGGETKFGISKSSYPNLNIADLQEADAIDIFKKDFWGKCSCDQLPAGLATALLDTAVLHGEKTAIKMLQVAAGVTADGNIGAITIRAIYRSPRAIMDAFLIQRLIRTCESVLKKPEKIKFVKTWMGRVIRLIRFIETHEFI